MKKQKEGGLVRFLSEEKKEGESVSKYKKEIKKKGLKKVKSSKEEKKEKMHKKQYLLQSQKYGILEI